MGYAVIQYDNTGYITSGVLRYPKNALYEDRLVDIFRDITKLCTEYQPEIVAIEQSFVGKFAHVAMKLGMLRGTITTAAKIMKIPTLLLAPTVIRKGLTGNAKATKKDIAKYVQTSLNITHAHNHNETDALAVALHTAKTVHISFKNKEI